MVASVVFNIFSRVSPIVLHGMQVEAPKVEPKLPAPFWGFTTNAEIWNSRAAMIGFFALLLLEAVSLTWNLEEGRPVTRLLRMPCRAH